MPLSQMTVFAVGDYIGGPIGDATVQIVIEQIEKEFIYARVVALGTFFSNEQLTGTDGSNKGFVLGELLTFSMNVRDTWIIVEPTGRPWHVLYSDGCSKKFENSRIRR